MIRDKLLAAEIIQIIHLKSLVRNLLFEIKELEQTIVRLEDQLYG